MQAGPGGQLTLRYRRYNNGVRFLEFLFILPNGTLRYPPGTMRRPCGLPPSKYKQNK